MTETPVKDSANHPLIDEADQAHAGHIPMFIYVLSAEEQQYKKRGCISNTRYILRDYDRSKNDQSN